MSRPSALEGAWLVRSSDVHSGPTGAILHVNKNLASSRRSLHCSNVKVPCCTAPTITRASYMGGRRWGDLSCLARWRRNPLFSMQNRPLPQLHESPLFRRSVLQYANLTRRGVCVMRRDAQCGILAQTQRRNAALNFENARLAK